MKTKDNSKKEPIKVFVNGKEVTDPKRIIIAMSITFAISLTFLIIFVLAFKFNLFKADKIGGIIGVTFSAIFAGVIFAILIYYIVRFAKQKKSKENNDKQKQASSIDPKNGPIDDGYKPIFHK